MSDRLAAAQTALNAGRPAEAIDHLIAAISENPARPQQVYRVLLVQLYQAGRYEEGASWAERATQQHPRDSDLFNLRGVMLRRLGRFPEALAALEEAVRLSPKSEGPQVNRANVLLDLKEAVRAEKALTQLIRQQPRNAELQRQLGRALLMQNRTEQALVRFRQAVALDKHLIDAWLDLSGALSEQHRTKMAEEALEKAFAANPGEKRLIEARAIVLRNAGQMRAAAAYLEAQLPLFEGQAWLHYQLGMTLCEFQRPQGNVHLRRAVELDPKNRDYLIHLIESLERTRTGDEGANIEEAYQLALQALELFPGDMTPGQRKTLSQTLIRVSDFAALPKVGDFRTRGRAWAENRLHTALLGQLGQVETLEDRYELLEQHRIWGRAAEQRAAERPVRRASRRRQPGERIRLGLMSSDLRRHPVGYFALPLFEHVDERFELFCYSFYEGQEDDMQRYMASRCAAYRWNNEIASPAAAQMIADDGLDILLELGGSTHMNKLDVMAYRPAPLQASWLGYPHSAGLSTIDHLICDPQNVPPRQDLLLERPLLMPKTWIALGRMVFSEEHRIEPGLPEDRSGTITFGTANNPHKYNPALFAAWAEVLRAVPGSRFLFIRPEGGSASFRRHVLAAFAAAGVAPERIGFRAVRGHHMPHYNEVDISLDTFPLTGGTTTTEALWMGVPVVSLIGEAFFERLSGSILANAGVAELATTERSRFTDIAVALAGDRARRLALRQGLREAMKSGPLGQTEQFSRDFYDMLARAVEGQAAG